MDTDRAQPCRTGFVAVCSAAGHCLESVKKKTSASRPFLLSSFLLISGGLLPLAVHAEEATDKPWTLNLYFENDLFAETDQNYTNGIRAAWVSPNIDNYLHDKRLPVWVRKINRYVPLFDPASSHGEKVQRNLVLSLGQQIYTPENIELTTLDSGDRPYAGWLYAGAAYHSQTQDRLNSAELNIGIIGPAALGQEAQDFIHDLRGFDKFQGWDNQLKNEPGIQLVYESKYRWLREQLTGILSYDLIVHNGISLGNVATYVNSGAEMRLGWHLPYDFGTSALRPGGDNSAPGVSDDRYNKYARQQNLGAHLFISGDGRWVLQDIFLDGNTFIDGHSVDKRPLVGEIAIGFATLYKGWKISFARVHRSREFKGQKTGHNYGSLSVSYSF
ncbi:MAG: lipid A deacylase LpxR family protein [Pontibacterium sp.]